MWRNNKIFFRVDSREIIEITDLLKIDYFVCDQVFYPTSLVNCKQGWKIFFFLKFLILILKKKKRFCGDRYNLPVLINDGLIDV